MLYFSEVILIILLMLKARGVHGISNKCGRTQVCREYDCTHQVRDIAVLNCIDNPYVKLLNYRPHKHYFLKTMPGA